MSFSTLPSIRNYSSSNSNNTTHDTPPPSPPQPLSTLELLQFDRQHVWHPYAVAGPTATKSTSASAASVIMDAVVPIESANGVYLKVKSGSSYDDKNKDNNGNQEIVDGMSNWWATIHGYNHMTLNHAIIQQVSQMSHIMLGGLTHEPVIRLCTKLCQLTQMDLCFVSDSGSVAVEVAMKMAIQYWNGRYQMNSNSYQKQKHTKSKFITVRNGYHGDTFMAMSVCDPNTGMHHQTFGTDKNNNSILPQHYFVAAPTPHYPNSHLSINNSNNNNDNNNNEPELEEEFDESHMQELMTTLELYHENIAAMIVEPIVQGAGGMRMYHPQYLCRVRELCTHYDVLLIYDEIATGFGRTNQFFGHHHCYHTNNTAHNNNNNNNNNNNDDENKYKPDIICLGKALTGGYMSLAATLTTNHVAEVIHTTSQVTSSDNTNTTNTTTTTNNATYQPVLMHGPTFMGNPLACSVALASISLLENSPPLPKVSTTSSTSNNMNELPQHTNTCTDWRRSVPMIEQQLRNELLECTASDHVQNVRVLGAIGVVEMKYPIQNMKLLQHIIVKEYNVWLRPFGKLIYTMPPFIISSDQLRQITYAMVQLTRRRF